MESVNDLNCLQDDAAKGKIRQIRHRFWCPFLVKRLMAEPNIMNWDTFFRVWAVIGPLLAGVASALWLRHIQVSDRKH